MHIISKSGKLGCESSLYLDEDQARLWARPRSEECRTDHILAFADLARLREIEVISSFEEDYEKQLKARKSRLITGAMTGALLGGLLDAGSGEDSILDGIFLGGIAGSVLSSSSPEKPIAIVNLYFQDNAHIVCEVDREGLGGLLACLRKAQRVKSFSAQPSISSESMPEVLKNEALVRHAGNEFALTSFALLVLAGGMFIMFGLLNTAANSDSSLLTSRADAMPSFLTLVIEHAHHIKVGVMSLLAFCFIYVFFGPKEPIFHDGAIEFSWCKSFLLCSRTVFWRRGRSTPMAYRPSFCLLDALVDRTRRNDG